MHCHESIACSLFRPALELLALCGAARIAREEIALTHGTGNAAGLAYDELSRTGWDCLLISKRVTDGTSPCSLSFLASTPHRRSAQQVHTTLFS